jgi:hypothetical protein
VRSDECHDYGVSFNARWAVTNPAGPDELNDRRGHHRSSKISGEDLRSGGSGGIDVGRTGNRRVRCVWELAENNYRTGLARH